VVWLAIAALALVLFAVTFPLYIRLLKYDAAKTLAAFGATLRSEVDLDTLRDHLLSMVQETMQTSADGKRMTSKNCSKGSKHGMIFRCASVSSSQTTGGCR
jgi:hypothetical protein